MGSGSVEPVGTETAI
jgi:hypothetical protein